MRSSSLKIAILGAGGRGQQFAKIITDSHQGKIVAVADPCSTSRKKLLCGIGNPSVREFESWEQFVEQPKMCDAVVIATLDQDHRDPAVACMEKGYHMLLEKPMAVTLEDCRKIAAAQTQSGVITAVCHSLRYNKAFDLLKELLDSGRIGRLMTLDQLEQVEWLHHAHSYVRGSWGNEKRASFMLMTKSCHDLDYIAYLVGQPCRHVSSFGSLSYFTEANAPAGSGERCTECDLEPTCEHSAIRRYLQGNLDEWPAAAVSRDPSPQAVLKAIETGPYGRCVWKCDNDVVDHQVVAMEFEGGITATFTMSAFTQQGGRLIRLHGTLGEIQFQEDQIRILEFQSGNRQTIDIAPEVGGHGGGDARLTQQWLWAVKQNKPDLIRTDVHESLHTHTLVFAAELARREHRTISLDAFDG